MYEEELVEEIDLAEIHDASKNHHRFSRKAKLKKHQRNYGFSINNCIGKYASKYGKRMIHRYNRRVRGLELTASDYYKHDDFSYGSILWALS